jgi:hypothetical protein
MKRFVSVAVIVAFGLTPAVSPAAEPTPNVTAEAEGSLAKLNLDLDAQNEQRDPLPAAKLKV